MVKRTAIGKQLQFSSAMFSTSVEKAHPFQVRFTLRLRDERSMWMQDRCKVHVWGPAWIKINWKSIRLSAQSHMASHDTWGFVNTLQHDFGGVLGWPLDTFFWALRISWSRRLARVWSDPQESVYGGKCLVQRSSTFELQFFVPNLCFSTLNAAFCLSLLWDAGAQATIVFSTLQTMEEAYLEFFFSPWAFDTEVGDEINWVWILTQLQESSGAFIERTCNLSSPSEYTCSSILYMSGKNRLSSINNRLKLETSRNIPIIWEVSIQEYTSNEG